MNTHQDPLTSSYQVSRLSNRELLERTQRLRARERHAVAEIVAHLAEVEARKLHLREGHSSLYAYCREALGYAEFPALARMRAARISRRFPVLLEYLAAGRLHLTAVVLLAPHLTRGNYLELFNRASGKSKLEVKQLVAEIAPQLLAKTIIRRVPGLGASAMAPDTALLMPASVNNLPVAAVALALPTQSASASLEPAEEKTAPCGLAPARLLPLSPQHYRVQFTADAETIALLKQCQDLLGHQLPNAQPEAVVKLALQEMAARLEKRKAGSLATNGSKAEANSSRAHDESPPLNGSRRVSAAVRGRVWARDHARCAYRSAGGLRCSSTFQLEFHHVVPYAHGGRATMGNIQLRCRAHNQYEDDLVAGKGWGGRVREALAAYKAAPLAQLDSGIDLGYTPWRFDGPGPSSNSPLARRGATRR